MKVAEVKSSITCLCGSGSSVGMATGYGLEGLGIESRWGARFSARDQTGPGAHPAFCTMGTGSFPWVKSGWGVTLTAHHHLVSWLRKNRAIPLPTMGRTDCTEPQCLYKGVLYVLTFTMYLCFSRCYCHNTFRHELLTDGSTACYVQIVLQRPYGITLNECKGNYDWELRNSRVDI